MKKLLVLASALLLTACGSPKGDAPATLDTDPNATNSTVATDDSTDSETTVSTELPNDLGEKDEKKRQIHLVPLDDSSNAITQATNTANEFDKSSFWAGLSDDQKAPLIAARKAEKQVAEASTFVIEEHPQKQEDDEKYTTATFLEKYLKAPKEIDEPELKQQILDKLNKTYETTKPMAESTSAVWPIQAIAQHEFYNVETGVNSWMRFVGNGWTIDSNSMKLYQYDENGTYQYLLAFVKDGVPMGYMLGIYYKPLGQTELSGFAMTQAGSLDNEIVQRTKGAIVN